MQYPLTMSKRLEGLRANSTAIRQIAARHKASSIAIFGSVARGEDTENSDYDFLVTFNEDSSLLDTAALMNDLGEFLGSHVDVVSIGGLKPRDNRIREEAIPL
jgi:predicted nucleotidyltransferase